MIEILLPIVIISVLVVLNGVFVAAEFGIVAVPRTRIAQKAKKGGKAANRVLDILEDPNLKNNYIATVQVGITIVSLALGMYGESVLAEWILNFFDQRINVAEAAAHTIATIISVGFLTYIHVVIGEMIPKTIALQTAEKTVFALDLPMTVLGKLFAPLVLILNSMGNQITKLFGIPSNRVDSRLFTSDELDYVFEESSMGGLIDPGERIFFENILDLQERHLEQVMTPRTRIFGIPVDSIYKDVIENICETNKTRYPVYDVTLDHIVGVLHIKDIARLSETKTRKDFSLSKMAMPAEFFPESLSIQETLNKFRRDGLQFGIVIDEFGGTAGIVSLEDLLEEVVGEIHDEFDENIQSIEVIKDGLLRVRGDLLLDEIEQLYGVNINHPEVNTINGLAMTILGRIPRMRDKFIYANVFMEVESVENRVVKYAVLHIAKSSKDND